MSRRTVFYSVLMAGVFATMAPAPAGAITTETYDKVTNLTFSSPVQVPGAMLDAGTYRFRLTNPDTSRNVLQVLSYDGSNVYAMFHTIMDNRTDVTDDPFVSFRETPAGVPPAIRSLFYGGEHRGYEFVYPKEGPVMIPEILPQSPITYARIPVTVTPEGVTESVAAPEPAVTEPIAPVEEPAVVPAPELPQTATPLPLAAVGGFVSLVLGLGVGLFRRLN
jgi:hypothetical protein